MGINSYLTLNFSLVHAFLIDARTLNNAEFLSHLNKLYIIPSLPSLSVDFLAELLLEGGLLHKHIRVFPFLHHRWCNGPKGLCSASTSMVLNLFFPHCFPFSSFLKSVLHVHFHLAQTVSINDRVITLIDSRLYITSCKTSFLHPAGPDEDCTNRAESRGNQTPSPSIRLRNRFGSERPAAPSCSFTFTSRPPLHRDAGAEHGLPGTLSGTTEFDYHTKPGQSNQSRALATVLATELHEYLRRDGTNYEWMCREWRLLLLFPTHCPSLNEYLECAEVLCGRSPFSWMFFSDWMNKLSLSRRAQGATVLTQTAPLTHISNVGCR